MNNVERIKEIEKNNGMIQEFLSLEIEELKEVLKRLEEEMKNGKIKTLYGKTEILVESISDGEFYEEIRILKGTSEYFENDEYDFDFYNIIDYFKNREILFNISKITDEDGECITIRIEEDKETENNRFFDITYYK